MVIFLLIKILQGNGMMIRPMAMVHIHILMAQNMRATGKKINRTVLERKLGRTVLVIKGIINKEESQAMENSNGRMVLNMKDNF